MAITWFPILTPLPSTGMFQQEAGGRRLIFDNACISGHYRRLGCPAINYTYCQTVPAPTVAAGYCQGQSFFIHANAELLFLTMDNRVRVHNTVQFLKAAEKKS